MPVEPKLPPAYVTMMSMLSHREGAATAILERVLVVHRPERRGSFGEWVCSSCLDTHSERLLWHWCPTMIAVADELGVRLSDGGKYITG